MSWHEFVQREAAKQRKDNRAEKTFPRFLRADVRHHQMPSKRAARQIRAHIREFGDGDQIQYVELAGDLAAARARSEIHNFSDEIEKPQDVEQSKQCIS